MAGSDIGVVGQDDAAFFPTNVRLIVDNWVVPAGFSVLADHDQARIEPSFWSGVRCRWDI